MTLHNYFHLLDSTHKQLFINFNWQILKSKNNSSILTDLTQSELLEIFSLFDYQLPDYQKGDFFQDISLINSLGGLLGFDNSILNHLFDFFIEKEITLAKKDVYDYHDHTAYQFQSVNHILDNFTQQPITPFTLTRCNAPNFRSGM